MAGKVRAVDGGVGDVAIFLQLMMQVWGTRVQCRTTDVSVIVQQQGLRILRGLTVPPGSP